MRQEKLGAKPLLYLRKPLKNEVQDSWLGCFRKPSEELLIRRFGVRFPGDPLHKPWSEHFPA